MQDRQKEVQSIFVEGTIKASPGGLQVLWDGTLKNKKILFEEACNTKYVDGGNKV